MAQRTMAYEIAEQKIEAARRSGATELDLSNIDRPSSGQLTELPESLGGLAQLQALYLGGNQLTALPESLGGLAQLQTLDLHGNQLTALPESLGGLAQLQMLYLHVNQLTALPESLGGLAQLQELYLTGNQLTALPESLEGLAQLRGLFLADNQLTALPESLGGLAQLHELSLSDNRLTALPEWLGRLAQLQTLNLSVNQLTALPESLGGLAQLRELYLSNNQLTALPESLGGLAQLQELYLTGNQLTALPESLEGLAQLQELYLSNNQLTALPESLEGLAQLHTLYLSDNQLTALPESLASMNALNLLDLDRNPLSPQLAAAYELGLHAVKRYLRELKKGAKGRYEAKLLILGDGNEGKTCVSRALRGLPFRKQSTTRGVDVEQWSFAHPDHSDDDEKNITLNIWDFEGQEISHQTHQFFLTSYSLYLLVFRCRDQFLMDRAEYWLDTIRARAPQAKVAIVITQCEERAPHIPLDRLRAQYGDLLAEQWFFAVGCKTGEKIDQLQAFLHRWAADLEFMGTPWPLSYELAEETIAAKKRTPHIRRNKLEAIFAKAGISPDNFEDASAALARLGVITQFPDCPELRDFVVLRPQWLTKAISLIMEQKELANHKGEISLSRLEEIWNQAGYKGMFVTFHNCMKEFELCYDLEDNSRSCLVPLRFGYERPKIPWSDDRSVKERRVEYKLNIRPPMGIMSRFIVKTHHLIVATKEHPKGTYWHNGVFLRSGEGEFCSEALCEFVAEDRTLRIEVRAAFPQNMSEQIYAYVKAVFAFFTGLEAERSYGCIHVDSSTQAETRCVGMHTEKRIFSEIMNKKELNCEFEFHQVDPNMLIWGFSSFGDEALVNKIMSRVQPALDKQPEWATPLVQNIGALLHWTDENRQFLAAIRNGQARLRPELEQQLELKLREYLGYMSDMLDDRDYTAAPALISIIPKNRSLWNPTTYFTDTFVLMPYCECPGKLHACADGRVEFTKNKAWWEKSSPWIARATKVLAAGLQVAFAGAPWALGAPVTDVIKDDIKLMEALTKQIELKPSEKSKSADIDEIGHQHAGMNLHTRDPETILIRAALHQLFEETAPTNYRARQWGSLRRVRLSDNSYRWLCEECAKHHR